MSRTHIATTPRNLMNALRFQGILVTESHAQLQAMLEKNLSPEHALFLAEPVQDSSGQNVEWYTSLPGPVLPLASLSPKKQQTVRENVSRLAKDIEGYAESLKADGQGPGYVRGGILSLALSYPGAEYIYAAGDRPVLTGWGFSSASLGVEPEPLVRLGAMLPPPPSEVESPGEAAPPAPPAEKKGGLLGPLAGFLLGLLILAGLYMLCMLLLSPSGCAGLRDRLPVVPGCQVKPVPSGNATRPDAGPEAAPSAGLTSALTAAQEKERSLRAQLDGLRVQLSQRIAECPRPARQQPEITPDTPPARPEPEAPPTLADLMPATPEPEPEPTPPPKPKAEPRPKQAEAPKTNDLVIPEDAERNNDLSFLEGCWNNATTLKDSKTGKPLRSTYCFDKNGRGTRTEQGIGHDLSCKGSASARFVNGRLRITASEAPCMRNGRKGGKFRTEDIYCNRSADGKADCAENKNDRWKAKLQRVK